MQAMQEAEIKKITVQGQPVQKSETPSQQKKLGVVVHIYNPSYVGSIKEEQGPDLPGKKFASLSQI
jgi:hypothetical protein